MSNWQLGDEIWEAFAAEGSEAQVRWIPGLLGRVRAVQARRIYCDGCGPRGDAPGWIELGEHAPFKSREDCQRYCDELKAE